MKTGSRIYVAGHRGLVGSAIVRSLQEAGHENLILRTSQELDLTNRMDVEGFFASEQPEYVFLAAAKVGGILANRDYPVDFLEDNLAIELNVIATAKKANVKKLLFLGSSCIYPKHADQPITEDALLTGPLEPTNQWYAIAKIAGIKLCQAYREQYGCDFISAMPTNLYGPHDNFDLKTSHVLPAMIRKFHEAKVRGDESVTLWGTGTVMREFLHVDDLADACMFLMDHYDEAEPINVGTEVDVTIRELAEVVQDTVGYSGEIVWDSDKPDGTPRKLLDVSRMRDLGWTARIALAEGVASTYAWYGQQAKRPGSYSFN